MTAPWHDGAPSHPGTGCALAPQPPARSPVPPSHHGHALARWPLRDFLELGALPGAVPCARAHTTQLLWEWGPGLASLADSAELIVSELITNAVVASRAKSGPVVCCGGTPPCT